MIKVVIHIFPHEIKQYERVICQLNKSFVSINDSLVKIYCCLNLNKEVCEHDNSEGAIRTFKNINFKSKFIIVPTINTKTDFYGVNEHRRSCIQNSFHNDYIIYLDCDLYFDTKLLNNTIINASNLSKKHKYFILTPECVRLWDTTWDCLVNKKFLKYHLNYCEIANISLITEKPHGDIILKKNNSFKWAGGWFTCINAPLAKLIDIPESFLGYGPDDTFMMECCKFLKTKNVDVVQYIQTNHIVCEDRALISKYKKYYTKNINFRKNCNKLFYQEYCFFKKRVTKNIYNINES